MSNLVCFPFPVVYLLMQPCQMFFVREVIINEPVTFPCTCSGNLSEVLWTRFIPRKADIATCHSQTCRIEQRCIRRFSVSGDMSRGNFSMRISSVVYNDAGSYRCTCDKAVAAEVKLRVYGKCAICKAVINRKEIGDALSEKNVIKLIIIFVFVLQFQQL